MTMTSEKLTPLERPVVGMAVEFRPAEQEALLARVKAIGESGYFLYGDQQEELATRFAELVGRQRAVLFSSVTNGFEALLRKLKASRGYENVLFQANAFPSMVFAARRVGMNVLWADIELGSGAMSIRTFDRSDSTDWGATVVVPQWTGGVVPDDAKDLADYARDLDAFVVEDSSQAIASFDAHGRLAGSFGDVACFSTSATKAFHTGQGGILVTDDEELADALTHYRQYGRTSMFQAGEFVEAGTNANQSEMNAAVGNVMLDTLHDRLNERYAIAQVYLEKLADWFDFAVDGGEPNWYKLPAMPKALPQNRGGFSRATFKADMKALGIGMGSEVYEWLTPQLEILGGDYADVALPTGERWAREHVCMPLHNVMTPADALEVSSRIRGWFES